MTKPGEGEKTSTMPGAGDGPEPEVDQFPQGSETAPGAGEKTSTMPGAGDGPDTDDSDVSRKALSEKPQAEGRAESDAERGRSKTHAHNPSSDLRARLDHQADGQASDHQAH